MTTTVDNAHVTSEKISCLQILFGLHIARFHFSVPTTMPSPTTTPEGKREIFIKQ